MPSISDIENYNRIFYLNPNHILNEENKTLDEIISGINLNNKKCLDFGCGTGYWIPTLLNISASEILGIDSSSVAVKYCSNKYPACRFSLYKDGFSDFKNGSFDFIMANWVFQEISDNTTIGIIIDGFSRIIRSGGLFLLAENIYPDNREMHSTTEFGDIFVNIGEPPLLRFFKNNTVSSILHTNFNRIHSKTTGESFFELYVRK